MSARDLQLPLLEVAPFAGGPARAPRTKRAPRITVASLTLPFSAPEPVAAPARWRKAPVPVPEGPPEERLLVGARVLGAIEKGRLEAALEEALGPLKRKRKRLVVQHDADVLELELDGRFVRAVFLGRGARDRWLVTLQGVAREHGLVEPE